MVISLVTLYLSIGVGVAAAIIFNAALIIEQQGADSLRNCIRRFVKAEDTFTNPKLFIKFVIRWPKHIRPLTPKGYTEFKEAIEETVW